MPEAHSKLVNRNSTFEMRRGRGPRISCHFRLRAEIPKINRYPLKLSTIGDHIRKRWLDLGLEQKEVVHTLGVTTWTISNWETKSVEPETRLIPKVIEFLGYVPYKRGETLGERITIYRKTLGLNHTQFAMRLGVARCTVFGWSSRWWLPPTIPKTSCKPCWGLLWLVTDE